MTIDRGMDKEDVVHTYNEYYSAIKKNESESVLVRWMNLEPVRQNEVSQKEKSSTFIIERMFDYQLI